MAEVNRHYCDVCGQPHPEAHLLQVRIPGYADATRDEVCPHCRAKIASAMLQLFDRAELRKLGLEAPMRQAAGTPQNQKEL